MASKAAVAAVTGSGGGSKVNSLLGIAILLYLCVMSVQSLVFSFSYSVYSFFAAGVLALGELPFLLSCGPLPTLASSMAPYKAYVYGAVSIVGITYLQVSWNIFLLAGHLAIGFLAYRCWQADRGEKASGFEAVPMDAI
eukprot:TRINITY_DN80672_c0_g1_i1.p1 TRINITY_DN80672_c0_g1~~TRINITY_DN80672_c0_g1_i1.p1  ORF type:complete len:160 (+),score=24.90 TRINITY_DN80672_c0_g1_i1:66-482(+)